jgi:protein SCO1/2
MKTKLCLAFILLLAATRADEPSRKTADACCAQPQAAAPFTRDSLYQLDAKFTDDSGAVFTLGKLRGRPVALTLFFTSCGYACPLLVSDLQRIQEKLPAPIRERTAFVLVSFDDVRDTPAALARFRAQHSLDASWTLLHGDADAVREFAALLGVKYRRESDGSFSHSNLITILNPAGEIAQQRVGLKGGIDEAAAAIAATLPVSP